MMSWSIHQHRSRPLSTARQVTESVDQGPFERKEKWIRSWMRAWLRTHYSYPALKHAESLSNPIGAETALLSAVSQLQVWYVCVRSSQKLIYS